MKGCPHLLSNKFVPSYFLPWPALISSLFAFAKGVTNLQQFTGTRKCTVERKAMLAQMIINLMMHMKESGMVIATTSVIIRMALCKCDNEMDNQYGDS